MDRAELEAILDNLQVLARHADYVAAASVPRQVLIPTTLPPSQRGSRFGGIPSLPPGVGWPHHANGPYRFLGQFNFSEAYGERGALPDSGILCIFVADDPDGDDPPECTEQEFAIALYCADAASAQPVEPPTTALREEVTALRLESHIDLPTNEELRSDWPSAALPAAMERWWSAQGNNPRIRNQLLGCPVTGTLAFDPTPGSGWCLLANFESSDARRWWWGDGGSLLLFIEEAKLKALDFSNVVAQAG